MVEQIRINPEEVRGYGNICEGHTLEDFIVSNSGLAKEKENVHGALTDVYKLVYSVYGLMFDFDKGNKQLYLQTAEADTLSFGFDTANKQLYLVDEEDTGFNLGFDEDTNELYITDDAPPIVHNYTLALDSESYTTTSSLSVSATLLDDGVAVEGATVSFTGGDSAVTATTNSSGVATATVTFSASGTLTASYSNVSDTATVTVQTAIYYANDFSDSSTISDFTDCKGTITKSITGGELVLTAPNSSDFRVYCNQAKLPKGDWKVTINSTTYNYLLLNIGYDPLDSNATIFDMTWNYSWGLIKLDSNMNQTQVKSSKSISLGTTGVWVFEYIDKVMKIYQNGTLKATYDLTSYDTIGGYVVLGDCCNRTNKISELIIEAL